MTAVARRFPDWDWLASHGGEVAAQLSEHVELTALAVAAGFLVAVPLALLARRVPPLRGPLLGFTGVLYTVPALALFVLLLPFVGLSRANPVIGLTIYSLLILLRNTLVGLEGVPAEVRESALAMGHTRRQLLWRVEVPVALPAIVAGVRLATVSTVGLVTITALIGYGGLGQLILRGFNRTNATQLVAGLVLSVALAAVADVALAWAQRRLTPWQESRTA
ncbi:MAG TPA: ABC transporter permease [Egibacteraceae bacterium]|nr:ABC transporter permease [Egibacteraceae bacterium]